MEGGFVHQQTSVDHSVIGYDHSYFSFFDKLYTHF